MKCYLLTLLVATICLGQSKQELKEARERREKYLFAATVAPKKFNVSIPVDYTLDELIIPVTINGKIYQFLFDTGAITVISKDLALDLGLKAATSNELTDAAGIQTQQDIFMLEKMEIAGISFSNVACAAMPLDSFSTLLCKKVDGLFGTNMMRLATWKIDYMKQSIIASSERIAPDFDFDTIKFEHSFSASPVVTVVTGGVRFPAMVDTGNNRYIDIPDRLYAQSKLPGSGFSRKSHGRASFSLNGNTDQSEIAVLADSLYFGDLLLKEQRLRVSPGSQILIGNKFLKQFGQLIISWEKSRIYVPRERQPLEKEFAFGFTPFIEDGKMKIVELWDGSDAKKLGIEINDIIIKVNDLDMTTMTPELWCDFVAMTKDISSLTVELLTVSGARKTVTLTRFELLRPD